MISTYGQGDYGTGLFGAASETLTIVITDNVTGSSVTRTATFNVLAAGITIINPGIQSNVVGIKI